MQGCRKLEDTGETKCSPCIHSVTDNGRAQTSGANTRGKQAGGNVRHVGTLGTKLSEYVQSLGSPATPLSVPMSMNNE